MRAALLLTVLLLPLAAPVAAGQRAAPVAVRMSDARLKTPSIAVRTQEEQSGFRGRRVLIGAGIGAVIVGTVAAVIALGWCDPGNCASSVLPSFAAGAAVGTIIGGIFGLIVALPRRD